MSSELLNAAKEGNYRALGRLLTAVEEGDESSLRAVANAPKSGVVVGITGPPGVGKSTLVDGLIEHLRKAHEKVAIVAVDPTSPFTGGALLGDRVRMMRHAEDRGVFIRSLGSRGAHGGIATATGNIVDALRTAQFDWILVESVGVGQTELDIHHIVDTVVVVFVPESGDTVQMMKAGITEIGDIFVVNKSDREGAQRMAEQLKSEGLPHVVVTTAFQHQGIDLLLKEIRECVKSPN